MCCRGGVGLGKIVSAELDTMICEGDPQLTLEAMERDRGLTVPRNAVMIANLADAGGQIVNVTMLPALEAEYV